MAENEIGIISHYFPKVSVGIIELTDTLKVGETVHVKGAHDDFTQMIDSMQIEHQNVNEAAKGDAAGVKVSQKVHPGDKVFKVVG